MCLPHTGLVCVLHSEGMAWAQWLVTSGEGGWDRNVRNAGLDDFGTFSVWRLSEWVGLEREGGLEFAGPWGRLQVRNSN